MNVVHILLAFIALSALAEAAPTRTTKTGKTAGKTRKTKSGKNNEDAAPGLGVECSQERTACDPNPFGPPVLKIKCDLVLKIYVDVKLCNEGGTQ